MHRRVRLARGVLLAVAALLAMPAAAMAQEPVDPSRPCS